MIISIGKSRKDIKWHTADVSWSEFLKKLETPHRSHETVKEYKAMSKDEKGRVKDVGGFVGGEIQGGRRKSENVVNRSMVTLDLDEAASDAWDNAAMWGWTCACYSTHSHTPEKPRLRLVFPLDRAVSVDEYQAISRRIGEYVGIEQLDQSTHEAARLMYWPSCPKDGEYVFLHQEGDTLCADEILKTYGRDEAWRDCRLWPTAKTETMVRMTELKKQGDPTEKPGIVGLFCRTYDVHSAIATFLDDTYVEGNGGRYTYLQGSTADGAVVYEDGAFLYSHHGTDPCGGQLVNAFDLVRVHLFGELDKGLDDDSDITKRPSYQKMQEFAAEDSAVIETQMQERAVQVNAAFGDLAGDDEGKAPEDTSWYKTLIRNPKTGEIEECLTNAQILVRNLPDFKGKLGYNPMLDSITVKGDLPWRERRRKLNKHYSTDKSLDNIFAADDTAGADPDSEWTAKDWPDFYAYMESYGFMTGKRKDNGMLENAVLTVAQEQTYHPIKSYLESLEWDGVERVDTMFIRWLGAEDSELNRTITRLWMLAGVDRIVRPGCQFDEILITCGPQGIGKSRLLRMLSKGFFTNSVTGINMNKQTAELLQGMWIVELGELDGMRKGEQTQIKNFITATVDRYRGAYARQASSHPRQCILAGTSNEGSFLRDNTGERRYWIMPVQGGGDRGELKGFANEVDQLWAEAVVLWKKRMREFREPNQTQAEVNLYLYLKNDDLEAEMEKRRQGYKLPDADRVDVAGYLDTLRPANWKDMSAGERRMFAQGDWIGDPESCTYRLDKVCIKELRHELFAGRTDKDLRIGDILDSLEGWKKGKSGRNRAYANWPMPMWVRIGSPEDTE